MHSVWVDSSFSHCPGPCPTGLFQAKHCLGYFHIIHLLLKPLLPISWACFSLADCYPHTLHVNTHIQQLEARTHTRKTYICLSESHAIKLYVNKNSLLYIYIFLFITRVTATINRATGKTTHWLVPRTKA